jgi:branched-chain amino acid transport system permease protein
MLNTPAELAGPVTLPGGMQYASYRLAIIAVGAVVALLLYLLVAKTRVGMLVRAGASNREMATAMGVNIRRLFTAVFALGAALAGLGGALAAPIVAVGPGLHVQVIIDAFVVVVIGGMGSVLGALVASLLVGIVNAFGILAIPGAAVVLTFALMAVVLIVRPHGLFGTPE